MEAEGHTSMSEDTKQFCEICFEGEGENKNASSYCTDCQQKFCNHCSKTHSSQKAFKQHTLVDISEMPEANPISNIAKDEVCEPCLVSDETKLAAFYCNECEEKLCSDCSILHGKIKLTKSHSRITIAEFKILHNDLQMKCEPCHRDGKENEAEQHCMHCDEDICSECIRLHKKFKATKLHELVDISKKQTIKLQDKRKDERLCEPCKEYKRDNIAFFVCKECKEFLCDKCGELHKVQKMTRTHHLIKAENVPLVYCEPCLVKGDKVTASKVCTVCEEVLCMSCIEIHYSLKTTKSHTLSDIEVTIPVEQTCCSSKSLDRETLAILYCAECEEFYCSTSSEMHKGQKATKTHSLVAAANIRDINEERTNRGNETRTVGSSTNTPKRYETSMGPGAPTEVEIQSDCITLSWQRPKELTNEEVEYQIRYKETGSPKWSFYHQNPDRATITIKGLKSECNYIFQVRSIVGDIEGPYSSESKEIKTKASLASQLLAFTTQKTNGKPSIYQLHSTENERARNIAAKTRKFDLGKTPALNVKEKTILLVGATGSGKTTLVDGIINYILGVNWKDPYRFTLVDLESDEVNKKQAVSQTEWVTCYTINPEEGSRLDYKLNIIDTPGFGDTRGLDRDQQIIGQLRDLFSSRGDKGVVFIDAVCFLVKAPDARLTSIQKYIFMSILSIFGKDIKDNICTLITFADGNNPPVLAAMEEAELPFKVWYVFNNSGLFEENESNTNSFSPMFWEMGNESFQKFFKSLDKMSTKSLQQTKQVLQMRQQLEVSIANLQPQVDAGLNKLHQFDQEILLLKRHEKEILDNKDFEYEVEETIQEKTELPKGVHVTNCLQCNRTCHNDCAYANDEDKKSCCVMDSNGKCTVCDSNCSWEQHHNTPYVFSFHTKKVKKTYAEKLKLYKKAGEKKVTHEQVVERMKKELVLYKRCVLDKMDEVNEYNNTLKAIALHPNPLSMVEHIDLMIESEKLEKKKGFQERIQVLQGYRQRAEIHKSVDRFKEGCDTTYMGSIYETCLNKKKNALKKFVGWLSG